MKLLFIADIHIKLGQKNVPVPWALNRFTLFLQQMAVMQEEADLVILGGDIFDRLPTMDELELYFDLVASITKPCIIYAGNHEAIKKDTTFLSFLKKATHRLNPLVRIVDSYEYLVAYDLDIIPYNCLDDFKKHPDKYKQGSICASHFRAEIPPHVKPELDLDLFNSWKVVLAGDLHSYENSQRNILYPGSPYTTSFHRSKVDTGAILFNTDTMDHVWLKFELPQLIKKSLTAGETPEPTKFHHTIYDVEGDMQELANLKDSDLIGKKVVKRSTETALMLSPEASITEELQEYLTYILELPEDTVAKTIMEFLANYSKLAE